MVCEMKKVNRIPKYEQESIRWGDNKTETCEDVDLEMGCISISSDESGPGDNGDLGDYVKVKPSPDIWQLVDVEFDMRNLLLSEEISTCIKSKNYDQTIEKVSKTEDGLFTAALWACWLGRNTLLSRLLEMGLDPNKTDEAGRTCLHLSCLVGSPECATLLLQAGADPNMWDTSGKATPLHCAASAKSLACVKVLIAFKADVNAGDERSPLHYAVLSQAPEVVKELLESGASPNTSQVLRESPLHVAASLGSTSCIKILVDAGADINAVMVTLGATPLHLAAEDGETESTRLLLDLGAHIDFPNSKGQTALHLAALTQSVEVVKLLLNRRADVQARDADGRTPLHGARACEVARLLLARRANPNAADNFGYTPLHLAALNELSACALLLIDYGAKVTLRTNGGVSALSFIVRRVPDVVPLYLRTFDDAVHVNEYETGALDLEILIDFRPLVQCLPRGEAELLQEFIEVGRKDVLKHPVAETFLFFKWKRVRKYFVLSFIYHALLYILFSAYVLWTFTCKEKICPLKTQFYPVQYLVIALNIGFFLKELFQAYLHGFAYVRHWENWLNWLIVAGIFLSTIPCCVDLKLKVCNTFYWQHDVAAITIFFCWLALMMIVGRFPTFGLYVQMFNTVTINFATFLLAYSCLLIAFALAFSVLFSNNDAFDIPSNLVKTVVMMSGELGYQELFHKNNNTTDITDIQYPGTAHCFFLIFVILVTIILTNLLVGLAVSDIQALQVSAELDRLVRQTQLVAHLESILFSSLLACAPKRLLTVLRWSTLLTVSPMRTLTIRPNDPRETRMPKDLMASVYKMKMASRHRKKYYNKKNSYKLTIRKCKSDTNGEHNHVHRSSRLFEQYSFKHRPVELRQRESKTSLDPNIPEALSLNDIKTQLLDLTHKMNTFIENTDTRLNQIANELHQTSNQFYVLTRTERLKEEDCELDAAAEV